MELDPAEHGDTLHRILTSVVTPRPIGWISTRTDERDNLAPFSCYNIASTFPPSVMFSSFNTDGHPKDSARMAIESGEFVSNLVTEDVVENMDKTAAPVESLSEFDFAGVEKEEAMTVDAPRVADAAACLECTVHKVVDVFNNTMVIGAVKHIYIHDRLTTEGVIDMNKVDSIGRIGGPYYTRLDFLDYERQNFGPWDGPIPAGFVVDEETNWLEVIPEEYLEIREALLEFEDGTPLKKVAESSSFNAEQLSVCYEKRDLYVEGRTSDERVEAALAQGGFETHYTE